jgi:hypothetical protein
MCCAALYRQTLAAFGSASVDDLLTIASCHTCAEAVCAFAFDDAGLECSLHGLGCSTPGGAGF